MNCDKGFNANEFNGVRTMLIEILKNVSNALSSRMIFAIIGAALSLNRN